MLFSVCHRAVLRAQIPKMTSKMSKYSPSDAKVLGVEIMVWLFSISSNGKLMTEAMVAPKPGKMD